MSSLSFNAGEHCGAPTPQRQDTHSSVTVLCPCPAPPAPLPRTVPISPALLEVLPHVHLCLTTFAECLGRVLGPSPPNRTFLTHALSRSILPVETALSVQHWTMAPRPLTPECSVPLTPTRWWVNTRSLPRCKMDRLSPACWSTDCSCQEPIFPGAVHLLLAGLWDLTLRY